MTDDAGPTETDEIDSDGDAEEALDEAAEQNAAEAAAADRAEDPDDSPYGELGAPLKHSPFYIGLLGGLGVAVAVWFGGLILDVGPTLILVVVAMFLAVGLNPMVEFLIRRGLSRPLAVLSVIVLVLVALALFVVAIAPIVSDQVTRITENAPGWLDELAHNKQIQDLNEQYDLIDKVKDYIASGDLAKQVFGGALNVGLAVLSGLFNAFVIIVLTLYFLASLPTIKKAMYQLAPASRRPRVSKLGDQILRNIGGYVSGAFIVAMCAGISSLVFLWIAGLGEYAVALAIVVALLDVIPMIGATLGAIIVCAIGFATDPQVGIACVIFYVIYQQVENYLIYPRVMSRSVDIPGAVTVIAALIGAGLLGVVGALLAIPTAAAILLLVREVFVKRQDVR
ncbi:MAG TPA: AI-2E family transporter [Marmoricola sp.]|nr:AI-2E family transporter [Marmoricola sp.]